MVFGEIGKIGIEEEAGLALLIPPTGFEGSVS